MYKYRVISCELFLKFLCVFLLQLFDSEYQKTLLSVKPTGLSVTIYYNSMKQSGIWIHCNFNYLTSDNRFLYLFNDITTTDVSASNKYDDNRRGPHLNLEVQESLYSALYTSQNVNRFQARFCYLWKISLFLSFYLQCLNAQVTAYKVSKISEHSQ
jgi:hypothetical protein